jgi:asparagine synthase (glutamine-hydrolysing)
MCGIAGIVSADRLDGAAPGRAAAMRDSLAHRGPDEVGLHAEASAVLAHRRLSIVDLSTGQQPLCNEDRTIWVVFNGEIYNHAAVRQGLETRGHVPDEIGHRNDRPRLRAVGRRVRERISRHVRVRPLGRTEATLAAGQGSTGHQAALLGEVWRRALFGSEIKAILASGLVEPEANVGAIPEL